ncbi:hypothetical protein D3C78_1539470 [compost metagenome]
MFSVAPKIAVPIAEPIIRVNTVQAVAMPRMLWCAAFCTETKNVVLHSPIPAPIIKAATLPHSKPPLGCISNKISPPATSNSAPSSAVVR